MTRSVLTRGLFVLLVASVFIFGVTIAEAWTGPTAAPPDSNASAPINVSSSNQTKAGVLNITAGVNAPAPGGYQSLGNYGGTGSAAYFPQGLWSNGATAWIYGDIYTTGYIFNTANTGYYLNPVAVSNTYALYRVYGYNGPEYDVTDSGYYLDPNNTSRFNAVQIEGGLDVGNGGDTYSSIYMRDDESPNGLKYIHANSNVIGFLSGYGSWLTYWDNSGNMQNVGNITAAGNITAPAFLYSSDRRLKENTQLLVGALEKIDQLEGVSFTWQNGTPKSGQRDIGVIAQDVEKVVPEAVHTDDAGYKSVDYARLVPLLINAIKEQQSEIDDLKAQIAELGGSQ